MAATSSQAASSGSTATAAIGETIVGSHLWKIDGFSATKDLGVGKSIKSSTFNVGGHSWYIECYPCGDIEHSGAGWVTLFLCLSAHKKKVEAECLFTLVDADDDGDGEGYNYYHLATRKHNYDAETSSWRKGIDLTERVKLESLIKDDCFSIRCDVSIVREFPAVPPPDLHRPLTRRDLIASHSRSLPAGPSVHVAADKGTPLRISTENVAGSHVLTIQGYSQTKKAFCPGESLESKYFVVGGHKLKIQLYPSGDNYEDTDCLAIYLVIGDNGAVKVRFELTVLTVSKEVISSIQSCYAFSWPNNTRCGCYFLGNMDVESSPLLGDSFHVKCDVTVVKEITPMRPPNQQLHLGHLLLASQVGADVEFVVGGELFSAHKCVLATRSTAFMAEFFGPAGEKGSSTTVTRVQINDMEPRVFKALLHFIYTDTLPEVHEDDDKIVMAQGLLVAADRYAMERLKLICADMLCNYMNDARTAVDALELAVKHGCHRLKEKCKNFLMDNFAKVAP